MEKKIQYCQKYINIKHNKNQSYKVSDSDIRANHLLEAFLVLPNTIKIKVCNRDRSEDN